MNIKGSTKPKKLNDIFNLLLITMFFCIFLYLLKTPQISIKTYDSLQVIILLSLILWLLLSLSVFKKFYNKLYYIVIIFAIVFTFFRLFIFSYSTVNGTSMYPTLSSGDKVVFQRTNNVDRFDVIIIKAPQEDSVYIKRAIAFEGESICFINGNLYIDNKKISEKFSHINQSISFKDSLVPKGYIYVLGDNRPSSLDSRILGPFPQENIIGKYLFKLPF